MQAKFPEEAAMPRFDAKALPKDALVQALRNAGSRTLTPESLEADIAAGAPVNENGTISLYDYAAWLLKMEAYRAG